jgi:hypothetical protein
MRTFLFLTLVLAFDSCVFGQAADSPLRFEAVAIKGADNSDSRLRPFTGRASWDGAQCTGGPGTPNPGLWKCHITFARLLYWAYQLSPLQFVAQP